MIDVGHAAAKLAPPRLNGPQIYANLGLWRLRWPGFGVAVLLLYQYLYLNPQAPELNYATTAENIANAIDVNREFCEDTVILGYSVEQIAGTGSAEFTNFVPATFTDPAEFGTFELTADIGGTPEICDVYQITILGEACDLAHSTSFTVTFNA